MNRIVTPDGMVPGGEGKPDRPPTLEERIETALEHWQYKRKDMAFATALNCIAYLGSGLSGFARITGDMRIENENLRNQVTALEKRLAVLEGKSP